jgi:hypothetical protein
MCYCKYEAIVGGFPECSKNHDIDECYSGCMDYEEEYEPYNPYNDEYSKPKWNEPKGRCREGIPDDTIKNKKYLNEYEIKEYWKKIWY